MNKKEKMFHSIERAIADIAKMQDLVIQLTREIHELHVAQEHDAKRALMKEQVGVLKTRLDAMQEFLYACERPTEYVEKQLFEVDVVL